MIRARDRVICQGVKDQTWGSRWQSNYGQVGWFGGEEGPRRVEGRAVWGSNGNRSRADRQWYQRKLLLNIRWYSYWQPVEVSLRATYVARVLHFCLHLNRRDIKMWLGALVCHWSCTISAMIVPPEDSAIFADFSYRKNEKKKRDLCLEVTCMLLCNRYFACFAFSLWLHLCISIIHETQWFKCYEDFVLRDNENPRRSSRNRFAVIVKWTIEWWGYYERLEFHSQYNPTYVSCFLYSINRIALRASQEEIQK